MKKISVILLTLLLVCSLAACGGGDKAKPEPSGGNTPDDGTQTEEFENKIDISTDKTKYDQAERIEVTMNFNDVDRDNAVIVIVSSDMPHGQTAPSEEDTEEYRFIADFSEIPFYLWAPEKDGLFDVRVYAAADGEELAFVTIAVGNATLPASGGNDGNQGAGNTPESGDGQGGVLSEGGDCTQKQMEDTIVSYLSGISELSSLTLSGGSRIEYTKVGDALNDYDFWTIYDPELDNDAMYEAMNGQLTAAGFTYEEDMLGRHIWYIDDGGEHKGVMFWPDDVENPDGYYILMMTYVAN